MDTTSVNDSPNMKLFIVPIMTLFIIVKYSWLKSMVAGHKLVMVRDHILVHGRGQRGHVGVSAKSLVEVKIEFLNKGKIDFCEQRTNFHKR